MCLTPISSFNMGSTRTSSLQCLTCLVCVLQVFCHIIAFVFIYVLIHYFVKNIYILLSNMLLFYSSYRGGKQYNKPLFGKWYFGVLFQSHRQDVCSCTTEIKNTEKNGTKIQVHTHVHVSHSALLLSVQGVQHIRGMMIQGFCTDNC